MDLKILLQNFVAHCLRRFAWFLVKVILFVIALEVILRFPTPIAKALQNSKQLRTYITFIVVLVVPKSTMFKLAILICLCWIKVT